MLLRPLHHWLYTSILSSDLKLVLGCEDVKNVGAVCRQPVSPVFNDNESLIGDQFIVSQEPNFQSTSRVFFP